jgi:hypothetical protein
MTWPEAVVQVARIVTPYATAACVVSWVIWGAVNLARVAIRVKARRERG